MDSRGAGALLCSLLLVLHLAAAGVSSAQPDDSGSTVPPPCPDGMERVAVTASTGPQQQQQGVEDATQSGHPCSVLTDACSTSGDQWGCTSPLPLEGGTVVPPSSASENLFKALLVIMILLFFFGPLLVWRVYRLCKRKSQNRARTNRQHASMMSRFLAHVRTDTLHRPRPTWTPGMPPPPYAAQPPTYDSEERQGKRSSPSLAPTVRFHQSNGDEEAKAAIGPPVPGRSPVSLGEADGAVGDAAVEELQSLTA